MTMDYQYDDIKRAYHNLIAAKEILFEAMEREIEAIESFEKARKKAMREQTEGDKAFGNVTEANLLDKIENEYNAMLEAQRDKRMASYDHEIAETRMQFFRDLTDWQKLISTITSKNAPGPEEFAQPGKSRYDASGIPREKSHENTCEKSRQVHSEKPRRKSRDETCEKNGSDHKELIQVS